MAKNKIFKIDLALSYIVSILEVHGTILNRVERGGEHILFEIYGVDNMLALEKVFYPHVSSELINIDIITNKSSVKKPLIFSARYYKTSDSLPDMWEFRIYQKDSRGCVYNRFSTVDSLPQKLFDIIKPLDTDIQYKNNLDSKYFKLKKMYSDLGKSFYLLSENDLLFLRGVDTISILERKQIRFSYSYYKTLYDKNAAKIDDEKQYQEAVKRNNEAKELIDMASVLMDKFSIKEIEGEE